MAARAFRAWAVRGAISVTTCRARRRESIIDMNRRDALRRHPVILDPADRAAFQAFAETHSPTCCRWGREDFPTRNLMEIIKYPLFQTGAQGSSDRPRIEMRG